MPIIVDPGGSGRTFLDLQDEVLHDNFSPTKYRTLAKRFINEAQRRIFRRLRIPAGEETLPMFTAAGEVTLDLDEDVARVNSLRIPADRNPLTNVDIKEIDAAPAASGKPDSYAVVGNKLFFYPTPNMEYELELRYQSRPPTLVDDDDYPALDDDYRDLLVTYARAKLFRLEDDVEMFNAWMADFETGVVRLKADSGRRDRSRKRQVPGMFASDASRPTFVRPS